MGIEVKNNRVIQTHGGGSLGFIHLAHLGFNGVADKAVQAFALTGGEILDNLPLALFDDDIDTVIGFLVVSGGGFLLRIVLFRMFDLITPYFYTYVSICKIEYYVM